MKQNDLMGKYNDWQRCETKLFWSDVAPNDHVVQIYNSDQLLLSSLEAFACGGLDRGDGVVIIATTDHLHALSQRLTNLGYAMNKLIADDQYIPLHAGQLLSEFMVNGVPEEKYFMDVVSQIMQRARKNDKKVRAFGEMVVLLWEKGDRSATIQLEHLWNKFATIESFCLYCAYPERNFEHDASASIMHICKAHSKLIRSDSSLELQYLAVE